MPTLLYTPTFVHSITLSIVIDNFLLYISKDTIKPNKYSIFFQLLNTENRQLLGFWLFTIPTALRGEVHRLKND